MTDVLVLGASVDGLVAAHYLARRGLRVTVLESRTDADARPEVGWVPPIVVRELGLRDLHVLTPDPWLAAPPLELFGDVARTAAALRPISSADAARWPEFCARMHRLAGVLERLYLRPPPDIETRSIPELLSLAALGLHVRRLGRQTIIDLARILPMSVAELLDEWFESDLLKGALGALGVWHLKQGPRAGGTAFNFLHHHVGSPIGVFRPARSNIRQVLEARPGITVRRGIGPWRVITERGAIRGVAIEGSAEMLAAPLVVSSASPGDTLRGVATELDPQFVRALGNIKGRVVALRGGYRLERPDHQSPRCVAPSLDYLERAYDAAKYGRDSEQPYVETGPPDPGGLVDVHVQYVAQGAGTVDLGRRVGALLREQVGPGRLSLEPRSEHLYHGELTLDQILFMRPVPGWSRYRTPIPGLYLCGPGTHPGGGIAGAAGRNAAREILARGRRSR